MNFCMLSIRSKIGKFKKNEAEKKGLEILVNIMCLLGVAFLIITKAPIGLNLLVCAKTRGVMVVDIISRPKVLFAGNLNAKAQFPNFSRILLILCNGESENWTCQTKGRARRKHKGG